MTSFVLGVGIGALASWFAQIVEFAWRAYRERRYWRRFGLR